MMGFQFLLGSLALAAVLSGGAALLPRRVPAGGRPLGFVVLGLPLFVLGLATAHLLGWYGADGASLHGWDQVGSLGLRVVLWGSVSWALMRNLLRLRTARRLLGSWPAWGHPALAQSLAPACERWKFPLPRLRVLDTPSPAAMGGWLGEPTVVVSRWLLEHLDGDELEAVLAHELAHLLRRGGTVLWVARLPRDSVWYLPWAGRTFELLETEEELEADPLAAKLTGQSLALASALGRFTEYGLRAARALPTFGSSSGWVLEERLRRLVEGQARPGSGLAGSLLAGGLAAATWRVVPPYLPASAAALLRVLSDCTLLAGADRKLSCPWAAWLRVQPAMDRAQSGGGT